MDEWKNVLWYICIMEYYLAIKTNDLPIHATPWMTLENIMLNERSQAQKITYSIIPFL